MRWHALNGLVWGREGIESPQAFLNLVVRLRRASERMPRLLLLEGRRLAVVLFFIMLVEERVGRHVHLIVPAVLGGSTEGSVDGARDAGEGRRAEVVVVVLGGPI